VLPQKSTFPRLDLCQAVLALRRPFQAPTYTADQLAEMLQVSLRQIWLMRDAGSIPAPFQVGRLVRWSRASIDTWIAAGAPRPR
jgi:excisionase family DNA binding protein